MIDEALLGVLVCPEDHSPLHLADASLLARLNRAIGAGAVKDRGGQPVTASVEAALVREDGRVLYPVVDEIPVLLIDRGLSVGSLSELE